MTELFADEKFRGWLYRISVLVLVGLLLIFRPDDIENWMPYIIGISTGTLASFKTSVRS